MYKQTVVVCALWSQVNIVIIFCKYVNIYKENARRNDRPAGIFVNNWGEMSMNKKNSEQVDPELAEFMKEFYDEHKEVMDELAKV